MLRAGMLALITLTACSHKIQLPNAAMSGPPGILQLNFERIHTAERPFVACDLEPDLHGIESVAIERTSCYGYCSMYTMTIHSDGVVEYRGIANVEHTGVRRGTIPVRQFSYLARLAEEIGFSGLQDSYECAVTDNPTVYVAVTQNGATKIIRHYAPDLAGPARLRAFEEAIDSVYRWIEWQH